MQKKALLEWQVEMGADEAIGDEPVNQFAIRAAAPAAAQKPTPTVTASVAPSPSSPLQHAPAAAAAASRKLADEAQTLADLEAAVRGFDGCAIKKTASKTVFADGNPKGRVMIIGEAPGAQEDIQGIPFCGPSGQLLDRMLAAIGLNRAESAYISNTVFWRPPGNRQPSPEETAICLPFVEKHIALVKPALLICAGGVAATTLLRKDQSISRLRGKFYDYSNQYLQNPVPTVLIYHPSYLLRSPHQKRLAWNDLLMIQKFLSSKSQGLISRQ